MRIILALAILLLTTPAHATWIHFLDATGNVTGVTDQDVTPPGEQSRVEVIGSVNWPIPAGCVEGKERWTRVAQVNPLLMEIRADVILFRCRPVESAEEIDAIVEEDSNAAIALPRQTIYVRRILRALDVFARRCPTAGISIPCDNMRAQADSTLTNFLSIQTLLNNMEGDGEALKTSRGW